jgi:hypothetical protein
MTAFPDHYAALGIDPTADQEVIAAAYRALAKKYHPDTGATTGTASPERFAEIQQAYEVLGSPESRARYDQELLDATQRELDAHLARKQRKIAGMAEPPPAPDLGAIRPERRRGKSKAVRTTFSIREVGPFLVVSGLLIVIAGGFASLYLSQAPLPTVKQPPPPPPVASQLEPDNAAAQVPASVPVKKPLEQKAALPAPAAAPLQKPLQQKAALPENRPLFGSSLTDGSAPPPIPAAEQETAVAEPAPPPVPKARPPLASPVTEPQPQPEPVETQARTMRFSVVIYEKYRTGDIVQEEGGILFVSEARCADFGERAVLRRLVPYEGQRQRPRIWYECVEAP